mmetsp:Transcript_9268/g.23478  ORF Transcript_9268/g.23478 Transcript_9268/m.23478 type:complete len:134 (-) Transcript_9268:88-489(-)
MAPELFKRGAFSKSVDVYALGIVIAETWNAEVPFDGYEPSDISERALAGERPRLPAAMPSALCELARECWDGTSASRPCAADVASRLFSIAESMPSRPTRALPRVGVAADGVGSLPAHLAKVGLADSLDALMR